jgi:hypothetical protein
MPKTDLVADQAAGGRNLESGRIKSPIFLMLQEFFKAGKRQLPVTKAHECRISTDQTTGSARFYAAVFIYFSEYKYYEPVSVKDVLKNRGFPSKNKDIQKIILLFFLSIRRQP